ncbi:MAG: phosphoethanolamine--lipid A transferase EptA [Paraglaciecola sp.]
MKPKLPAICSIYKASNYTFLISSVITIAYNFILLGYVVQNTDVLSASGLGILVSVVVIVFIFSYAVFSLLTLISLLAVKTFFVIVTAINAIAIYFMTIYQVVLDRTMIENILNTRYSESVELFSLNLISYILIFGLLPGLLLTKIKVTKLDRLRVLANALIAIIVSFSFLYTNSTSWLWIDKHASNLGGKILPWSYIVNSARHLSSINRSTVGQKILPDGLFINNNKMVFVLVIGETARADNFSLYGYSKLTNPKLQHQSNMLVFNNTKSCTTYTTGSLACMLAPSNQHLGYEALPTYLARQGVDVQWRTNNWGEPPIEVSSYVKAGELRSTCSGNGCNLDEVLLTNLTDTIKSSDKEKVFVVLHTKGSHGPSYYSRYTKEFNQFKPVCRDEEISKCSSEALINAYNNTILYTDHFLSKVINKLEKIKNTSIALMYISDHGESLGEHGLYLHGTPYSFAPEYQKNIPFLIWLSDKYVEEKKINISEMRQAPNHSQFNVFHTVLGAFGFESPVYESAMDVLHKPED